jgi:ubiquinone/menaquinone biosynthesis C-methylase UbiE
MTVVDLACGTGMVSSAVLSHPAGPSVKIIAVDFSAGMLAQARRRLNAPNVEFHQQRVEKLTRSVTERVDRVLCSAAFWHFDKKRAFEQIARVLKPSGKCLIGLPVQDFKVMSFRRLYAENKIMWMIHEEKKSRGYGLGKVPEPQLARQLSVEKQEVVDHLKKHGLGLENIETISVNLPAADYLDFLRIPIMHKKSFLFTGVPPAIAKEILDVVTHQLKFVEASTPPLVWQIYVINPSHSQ